MIKTKLFKVPLYGHRFHIIYCDDVAEYNAFIRRRDKEAPEEMLYEEDHDLYATAIKGIDVVKGVKYYALYLLLNDQNPYDRLTHGVIAHEANHIKNFIFDNIGHVASEADEPESYLLEWIVDQATSFLISNGATIHLNR